MSGEPERKNTYKILIENRDYSVWSLHDPLTFEELYNFTIPSTQPPPHNIQPLSQKYFNKDIFETNASTSTPPTIIHSPIREAEQLAGILVLNGNKTYGLSANKKKLLYKCIPDDKRLPFFFVPYEMKPSYSKYYLNKYVLFRYNNWNSKFPHGTLVHTLGDMDKLDAFYEYQLYRKSLQVSMTELLERAKKAVNNTDIDDTIKHNSNFMFEDRTKTHRVITIDNPNTVDFDDGISIRRTGGAPDETYTISIYISNVFIIIETLNLWNSLTKRVSTIYLPDRRRPMIPSILSDNLCSLREGTRRFTFVCDFIVKNGEILDFCFNNAYIYIEKNYTYATAAGSGDTDFALLQSVTKQIENSGVKSPNDVVAFWMIKMNSVCAEKMMNYKNGIYKSGGCSIPTAVAAATTTTCSHFTSPSRAAPQNFENGDGGGGCAAVEEETRRVIRSWNNTSGQYMYFTQQTPHDFLGKTYIHITSPIRRLVDLLNQTIFLQNLGLITEISNEAREFLNRWMGEIEYINTSMRAIRKIQTDCYLLQRCMENPDVLEKTYEGIVFDKLVKGDGGLINYMVYLQELRLLSRISILGGGGCVAMENFEKRMFRIIIFDDKDSLRRKIRLHMVDFATPSLAAPPPQEKNEENV